MTKVINGVVISARPKTALVEVARRIKHPRYGKYYLRHRRYQAHDEIGVAVGDKVEIRSCRPISRHKSFMVVSKL